MGGEMTYGQTIGFLRNADTVWWGFAGTSLKGGVWGLLSGLFIGLGLIFQRIKVKTILLGFLIFLIGLVIGLKVINDPKVLYFSNPYSHPRNESWAGLLFAAIGLLVFLKIKTCAEDFKIVWRFALYGLTGGGLGFGLGSLWITVGAQYGSRLFIVDWWKMMEFTFGFLLGGFLGFAAWRSNHIDWRLNPKKLITINKSFATELVSVMFIGFLMYAAISWLESYLDITNTRDGIFYKSLATIGRVVVNFTFIGCALIMITLRWPHLAFQIAVTLTFCHCVIDLVTDERLFPALQSSLLSMIIIIIAASLVVGLLVAAFQRKPSVLRSMLLILVWSTIAVALVRMFVNGDFSFRQDHSLIQVIIGDLFVFDVFMISAIMVSVMVMKNKAFRTLPAS
jgi:hypothetical protein